MRLALFAVRDRSYVQVTLSQRNLRALLVKLRDPDSKRTIQRDCGSGVQLSIIAEPDDLHYAKRPPGPMAPWTEAAMLLPDEDEDA